MKPRKFTGANARDALKQVKDALGPDALILSTSQVGNGVEIVALSADAIDALAGAHAPPQSLQPSRHEQVPLARIAPRIQTLARGESQAPRSTPQSIRRGPAPAPAPAPAEPPQRGSAEPAPSAAAMEAMAAEIRSMRALLEQQVAGLAWSELGRRDPAKLGVMRNLLGSGFSPGLARRLAERTPDGCDEQTTTKWLAGEINRNLDLMTAENDIIDRGGVYAIVGPTGVGKTTTCAKLAARCVVRHGADRLALLTTDSYRIGAHEQLRIYGKILGVTVHAVKDGADLRVALAELRGKHMVLIDTIGMSQRDKLVAEQVAMLAGSGAEVRRLLLLNATSNADTLDDVVRAYQGKGLAGTIITKLDEAGALGGVLDVIIRNELTVHYVANGQRVPEDLHLPNRRYLLHRALRNIPADSPHALTDADYPLLMAAQAGSAGAATMQRQSGARLA